MIVIGNLNASTKYYVRALASTKVGRGDYSESKGKFTNGGDFNIIINLRSENLHKATACSFIYLLHNVYINVLHIIF